MLSDEMTTGSVTTSDADKRAFASRSHQWNLNHKRFKDAFPDVSQLSRTKFGFVLTTSVVQYCTETLKDLPNMAQKERGKSDEPRPVPAAVDSSVPSDNGKTQSAASPPRGDVVGPAAGPKGTPGWAALWRKLIWEKWRWGLLIVLAVVVSRLST